MTSAARRFVQNIAKEHGYLGEEVYARMDADIRRQVQEVILRKDEMIGSSVITLAKNLYSKDVRFIFELLQNASDNHFELATASNADPYISFSVYKDRIVIDCNEDGFNEANIRAICDIGKSSKKGAQGYVGEKGIGFKSVFKVAWKVHIQSGYYSFTFTHRKGDSGMGMISPEWQETTQKLPTPLTRIILSLHGDDIEGGGDVQRQSILQQLGELQPAMLLFLKNLKRLEVHIHNEDGNVTSSILSSKDTDQLNRRILEKAHTQGTDTTCTRQKYYVTRSAASGLFRSENREYTAQEEETRAYSTTEIVLAFPLSDADEPLVQQQEVFAFLPVRRAGFNFLIHSDFVTQANREDIVASSRRNISIRRAIAGTFLDAIKQFCEHPTLKFQWMRYLPKLKDYPWDSFWQGLVDEIKKQLCDEELLCLRESYCLKRIEEAKRVGPIAHDKHGHPLFNDLPGISARYISDAYDASDLDLLKDYGLAYMDLPLHLRRVERDLSSDTSKMYSSQTDEDWHTRAARLLNLPFERWWAAGIADMKAMRLIPLIDGRWVSPTTAATYFATTQNGLSVPVNIGLHLVDPIAAGLGERRKLFLNLGVKYAQVDDIRKKILQRYQSTTLPAIDYKTSLSHLKFLYLTHTKDHTILTYSNMGLCDTNEYLYSLRGNTFYCQDENPYSLWNLVSKVHVDNYPYWPNVQFMSDNYFKDPPHELDQHDLTWKEWLHTYLGVRRYPRLVSQDGLGLSEECRFVAENLPSDLLGFLKYSWDSEKSCTTEDNMRDLRDVEVPCRGGPMVPLAKTWLPLSANLRIRDQFMLYREFFPFLDIEEVIIDNSNEWRFLKVLGLTTTSTLKFRLDVLDYIRIGSMESSDFANPERVLLLYLDLYRQFIASNLDSIEEKERKLTIIRAFFEERDGIFLPAYDDDMEFNWVPPSECLLDGPLGMRTMGSILPVYRAAFPRTRHDLSEFKKFLHDVLGIQRCSWDNIMDEIGDIKASDQDFYRTEGLYEYLRDMKISKADSESMKNAFENDALIFADVGPQKWFKPSQCMWSAPISIRGRVNLSNVYDSDMEEFFVEKVGVRRLDGEVVYNELLELNPNEATVEHVKDILWTLNSQLELAPLDCSADQLLTHSILPVRDVHGQASLYSSDTEFAIIDRSHLGDMFRGRLKALDFTTNEVCQLAPFMKWTGLESRYLSRLVEETSVLDSGVNQPISDPAQDISKKAYGLLRIATHFRSPRIEGDGQALYDLLRNSGTWETQGISTTLTVSIDGQTISEEIDRGEIHIDETDGLDIYLPYDEERRDDSYLATLPDCLTKWLMSDPTTSAHRELDPNAEKLVQGVLTGKVSQVNRYLDKHGVIEVDIVEQVEQEEIAAPGLLTPVLASTPTAVGSSTPRANSPFSEPSTPIFDGESSFLEPETPGTDPRSYGTPSPSPARHRPPLVRGTLPPEPSIVRTIERQRSTYGALLSQVVSAARRNRLFANAMDFSDLRAALDDDSNIGRTTFNEYDLFGTGVSTIERDRKVGAAGELFVFELLHSMNPSLGRFTTANWTSTIRRHATNHPDYTDMESWVGIETSDMEYSDYDGTLTKALIGKGHLHSSWRNRRPQYYIEVKTTPGPWDYPFFMSGAQYNKMRRLATDDSIYIIFRVFNLYSSQVDVNIYIDPARLADEGRLIFTADKWTVKPAFAA